MNKIETGNYKHFGQLIDRTNMENAVEEYVWTEGHPVPEREKHFDQLVSQANGESEVTEYVWNGGKLVKVDPASGNQGPIIHTTEDKVFAE